ncbi:hypothetical protein PRECH8_15770 [Insulibacter thermoxylanivorax]|uniref:LysM domain-containing protein n=1 Tax=Insulibacter thermoxylanivorax TaxID=2749268 RepID=A0A916QGX1_9BACL|nr:LysM peptidoglycan-binding domain-containing protein [Insulibacter thermoxylanivorax]GFR38281.1 hypothetical protein PRECH8_15770 [Insulibacter thermoxylanivorax]
MVAVTVLGYMGTEHDHHHRSKTKRGQRGRHRHYALFFMNRKMTAVILTVLFLGILIGMLIGNSSVFASSAANPYAEARVDQIQPYGGDEGNPGDSGFEQGATVKVQAGDTLWKIAREHKPKHVHIHDYIGRLKDMNGLTGSILYEGMLLRLP